MSSHELAIESLLLSSNIPISFRYLSSHLKISNTEAQSLLISYAATHPNTEILWCITTLSSTANRNVVLTTCPPSTFLTKGVWAIATSSTLPLWFTSDSDDALKLSGAPVAETNSLRNDSLNSIKSDAGIWKPSDAAESAGLQKPPSKAKTSGGLISKWSMRGQDKPFGGALLAEINRGQKAKGVKRTMSHKNIFKSLASNSNSKKKASSSACTRLGAAALAKIRAANQDESKKTNAQTVTRRLGGEVSKGRRIIEEDSDDGDSDVDKEQEALQREAAEQERAEKERARMESDRQEVALEAKELFKDDEDDDDEEPQSPTIRDLDDGPSAMEIDTKNNASDDLTPEKRKLNEIFSNNLTPEKRKLNEALGMPEVSRPRRIKKEVRETFPGKDGYMIDRVVIKEVDENGHEIIEEKAPKVAASNRRFDLKGKGRSFLASSVMSKVSSANARNGKAQSNEKAKDARKSSASLGTSLSRKASKKMINGNIWSYFK